jgi:hypothetical protein
MAAKFFLYFSVALEWSFSEKFIGPKTLNNGPIGMKSSASESVEKNEGSRDFVNISPINVISRLRHGNCNDDLSFLKIMITRGHRFGLV